jgi:hypothetical protein
MLRISTLPAALISILGLTALALAADRPLSLLFTSHHELHVGCRKFPIFCPRIPSRQARPSRHR